MWFEDMDTVEPVEEFTLPEWDIAEIVPQSELDEKTADRHLAANAYLGEELWDFEPALTADSSAKLHKIKNAVTLLDMQWISELQKRVHGTRLLSDFANMDLSQFAHINESVGDGFKKEWWVAFDWNFGDTDVGGIINLWASGVSLIWDKLEERKALKKVLQDRHFDYLFWLSEEIVSEISQQLTASLQEYNDIRTDLRSRSGRFEEKVTVYKQTHSWLLLNPRAKRHARIELKQELSTARDANNYLEFILTKVKKVQRRLNKRAWKRNDVDITPINDETKTQIIT